MEPDVLRGIGVSEPLRKSGDERPGSGGRSTDCRAVDPKLPRRRRQWWIVGPWDVPQAATFWRRELLETFGPFREDMHYAFDTEYDLRLVLDGVLPAIVEGELVTPVIHPTWDASSGMIEVGEQPGHGSGQ